MSHSLGEATIAELRGSIEGTVAVPGDPDYDEARTVWNAVIDRRPALVLRCTGIADVIAGVSFARSEGLPIAVRGGAHSVAGFSTCDDGLVIDLGPMSAVHVDPQTRRARVQGAALWRHIDRESQVYGLATTGGLVSTTGVGGFALGGGIGHLVRKHGLTCDNILSAELVTADGQLVRADEHEKPELLWGLRGGGANFGVVTSMALALHPVGPTVVGGIVFFPSEQSAQVLRGWRDAVATAPDELTTVAVLTSAPPLPVIPEQLHGAKVCGILACWAGPHDEGERVLAPLRALAEPIAGLIGPIPYTALQQLLDPMWARGSSNYFTSAFLDQLPDEAVETFVGAHRHAGGPPALCELHIHHLGGAMGRVPSGATAFAERGAPYVINCIGRTPPGVDPATTFAWARDSRAAMSGYGSGAMYVNFTSEGGQDRARESYSGQTYERLAQLKRRYDPENVFRFNQNVVPSHG
ncbi:MAG: FAD-binding oxidoreductase [Dermatophilaceae bacterium]